MIFGHLKSSCHREIWRQPEQLHLCSTTFPLLYIQPILTGIFQQRVNVVHMEQEGGTLGFTWLDLGNCIYVNKFCQGVCYNIHRNAAFGPTISTA